MPDDEPHRHERDLFPLARSQCVTPKQVFRIETRAEAGGDWNETERAIDNFNALCVCLTERNEGLVLESASNFEAKTATALISTFYLAYPMAVATGVLMMKRLINAAELLATPPPLPEIAEVDPTAKQRVEAVMNATRFEGSVFNPALWLESGLAARLRRVQRASSSTTRASAAAASPANPKIIDVSATMPPPPAPSNKQPFRAPKEIRRSRRGGRSGSARKGGGIGKKAKKKSRKTANKAAPSLELATVNRITQIGRPAVAAAQGRRHKRIPRQSLEGE